MSLNLNQLVDKESTNLTATEAAGHSTVWTNLLNESKWIGTSKPERDSAIQRIKFAISNIEMRVWHREVLEGLIKLLEIEPYA